MVKQTKTTTQKARKSAKKKVKKIKPEQFFIVKDGTVLKDLKELALLFEDISPDVFNHHVGPYHNHFCDWIEGVMEDKELADILRTEYEINRFQKKLIFYLIRKYI